MRKGTVLAAVAVVIACCGPAARAQEVVCDAAVLSDPGVLEDGRASVENAVRTLSSTGADVRVRAFAGGQPNLDGWFDEMVRRCPSWGNGVGGRRPNLIVVAVSVGDRRTGTYTGDTWRPALADSWVRIQRTQMNPRFQKGDISGGLVAGLRAIGAEIAPAANGRPVPSGNGSGGLVALAVVGGLVLVGGGAAGGLVLRSSRRKRREARERTLVARDAAAAAYVSLDEQWAGAVGAGASLGDGVGERDRAALDALLKDAGTAVEDATRVHVAAADAYESSPPKTLQDESAAQSRFAEAKTHLDAATTAVANALARAELLAKLAAELPSAIPALRAAVAAGRATAERIRSSGYRIDEASAKFTRAEELAAEAEQRAAAKDLMAAKEALDSGTDLVERTVTWVDGLPALRAKLDADADELDARLQALPVAITGARGVFDTFARDAADACWEPVSGNGSEAEKRRDATAEALATIRENLSMDRQQWTQAQEALTRVDTWLDEADTLLQAIHALRTALDDAKRDLPGELEAARTDVDAATAYVRQNDADVSDDLDADLRRAADALTEAQRLAALQPPDLVAALRSAKDANETADRVLAQARSEHEALERLRTKAASALRDAGASVSRAEGYLRSHRGDVGSHARSLLADAGRAFDDARRVSLDELPSEPGPRTGALQALVDAAEAARSQADDAYEHARRAFRAAEDERSRSTTAVAGAVAFGAWGSSSSGGGGGSGGSSGWSGGGGGGGGTGGSTGW